MSVGNLNKRLFFCFVFILNFLFYFYFFKSPSLVFSNPIAVKKKKEAEMVYGAAPGGLDTVSNCLSCLMCITLFSKVQYLSPSIEGAGW